MSDVDKVCTQGSLNLMKPWAFKKRSKIDEWVPRYTVKGFIIWNHTYFYTKRWYFWLYLLIWLGRTPNTTVLKAVRYMLHVTCNLVQIRVFQSTFRGGVFSVRFSVRADRVAWIWGVKCPKMVPKAQLSKSISFFGKLILPDFLNKTAVKK